MMNVIIFAAIVGALVYFFRHLHTTTFRDEPKRPVPEDNFRIRSEPPPSNSEQPRKYKNYEDEDECCFWEVETPKKVKANLVLVYTTPDGETTRRSVSVTRFGKYGPTYMLTGWCKLRQAFRSFRVDRIRECVDEDTGEVVFNVAEHLDDLFRRAPERATEALLEAEYDVLRILLYVGKADGRLTAKEKVIIREACKAMANDSRITDEAIDALFKELSVPSIQAFRLAVGRVASRDTKTKNDLFLAATKMIAAEKTIHASEQDALDYMSKRFELSLV